MNMYGGSYFVITLLIALFAIHLTEASYSASEDARILTAFRRRSQPPLNHAKVTRQLVYATNWASVGSISTDTKLSGFPMVNVISIADSAKDAPSTGKIYFLLTDLDFTGKDWRKSNKVTFLFSSEQRGNCSEIDVDPMEPTCARAVISGNVKEIPIHDSEYQFGYNAFISRHPAAKNWIEVHHFYLCVLDIQHIYVLDWYGGPKDVSVKDYYDVTLLESNDIGDI